MAKIEKFKALSELLLRQKKEKVYTQDALDLTAVMLQRLSDFTCIWNYRREIVLHMIHCADDKASAEKLHTQRELALTEKCISRDNPKSYSTWQHRKWLVQRGHVDLAKELDLCKKFLRLDERNFHCWNYRRFIVAAANIDAEAEFGFTTEKMEENFSNFSSLHYRATLLSGVVKQRVEVSGSNAKEVSSSLLKDEVQWIQNAIFTEPDDQSSWLYLRWLLLWARTAVDAAALRQTVQELIDCCNMLLEDEADCKWALLTLYELLGNDVLGPQSNQQTRLQCLKKLKEVDPVHEIFYATKLADQVS